MPETVQRPNEAAPEMNAHDGLGFSTEEYARRYRNVLAQAKQAGIEAMLIRGPENICYLTGYDTAGYYGYHCLIVGEGIEPVLVLRRLEKSNVDHTSWLTRTVCVEDHDDPLEITAETLRQLGLDKAVLGIEKTAFFVNVAEYEGLSGLLPGCKFWNASGVVESARLVKSDAEVEMIRRATGIADKAIIAGIEAIAPGATENDVASEVHRVWCREGAEYTGAPNYIVAGPRGARAHSTWAGGSIGPGDPVFLEIAASQHRYAGVVMRCATAGSPSTCVQAVSDATISALEAVIAAIRPGAVCTELDRIGRDIIAEAGFGDFHHHRLGYALGVNYPPDWGEGHILSIRQGEERKLEPNMTFHLVPACLVPEVGGIGCSATVRVTEDGCEVLNDIPAQLFVR